jgi:hypothetical protein
MLLAFPAISQACSRLPFEPSRVNNADAAITGEVVAVVAVRDANRPMKRTTVAVTASNVDAISAGETVEVLSAADSATCGLSLVEGDAAGLLLMRNETDEWSGTSCGTTSVEQMEAVIGSASTAERAPASAFQRLIAVVIAWIIGSRADATDAPTPAVDRAPCSAVGWA